ncbi:unnamed protein product, partial [Staurois parvus]
VIAAKGGANSILKATDEDLDAIKVHVHVKVGVLILTMGSVGGPMRCPWYLFHRLF